MSWVRTDESFEAFQTVPCPGRVHDVDVCGFAVGFVGWGFLLKLFDCEQAGRIVGSGRSEGV